LVQGNTALGSLSASNTTTISNGTANPVILAIGSDNTSGSYGGVISDGGTGSLGLTKNGTGTLTLTGANSYSGGTVINDGILAIASDSAIGTGTVSISALGTLSYSASTSTTKSFITNGGTIAVAGGAVLTLNGSSIASGYLGGSGTFSTSPASGARFANVTSLPSATILSNSVSDRFINFSNSAALNIAGGIGSSGPPTVGVTFNSFTNQGLGAVTVGAVSFVNAANFQSYGTLTLNPAVVGSGQFTLMTNTGTSAMYFDTGSRTFVGTPATANSGMPPQPTFVSGIDLAGKNLVIAGGLFVNNGFVVDSVGGGSIIVDYNGLYKGAGYSGVPIITQNGGRVQAGNSPGVSTAGSVTLGPGGTQNFLWQINNATGTAGPTADTNNQVSGWSLIKSLMITNPITHQTSTGNLSWTAMPTAGNQFQFALQTLMNPTTVGSDNPGPMANFVPTMNYMWPFISYAGTYSGPTGTPAQIDAQLTADTLFDPSGFANSLTGGVPGTFSLHLDQTNQMLDVVYNGSPVPEPGTLALGSLAGLGLGWMARRRRAKAAAQAAE